MNEAKKNKQYLDIELFDYFFIIKKKIGLIILISLGLSLASFAISFLFPTKWNVDCILLPSKFLVQTQLGEFVEIYPTPPEQIANQINRESYNHLVADLLKLDIRKMPKIKASVIEDTKLVNISIKTKDIEIGKKILITITNHISSLINRKADIEIKNILVEIENKKNQINEKLINIKDAENQIEMKKILIKNKDNEIYDIENKIKMKQNQIFEKDADILVKEIEKSRLEKEIEADKNKLKISEDKIQSYQEEMKVVKDRIDELDRLLKNALADKRQSGDSIALLLYSNEIQQNLRYYNSLNEKLNDERTIQENIRLAINDKQERLRQIDANINQIKIQQDSLASEINVYLSDINKIKNEKEKMEAEILVIKNDIERIKNSIRYIENEIAFLQDKKNRIDYAELVKPPVSSLRPVSPRRKVIAVSTAVLSFFLLTIISLFIEYSKKIDSVQR
jgi:predicted  nucleic acid-binding Zn-ribbon protein